MNKEKIQHHIFHLQEKHDKLDKIINLQIKNHSDGYNVKALKKEKLALKDEIESFKKQLV